MALTVEQIDTEIDALLVALGKGEHAVAFEGRSVVYKDATDQIKRVEYLRAVRATFTDPPRPRQWAVYSSKGFDS